MDEHAWPLLLMSGAWTGEEEASVRAAVEAIEQTKRLPKGYGSPWVAIKVQFEDRAAYIVSRAGRHEVLTSYTVESLVEKLLQSGGSLR